MNLDTVSWKLKALAAVAVVAIIAGAGAGIAWWATSISYDADIATLNKTHADEKAQWDADRLAIAAKAQHDTAAALQRTHEAQDKAAEIDKYWSEKFANAQKDNEDLRRDVTDGKRRVRLLTANLATAQLAASQHATSGGAGSGSVGDDSAVELSTAAGQRVLDIRAGIIADQAKVTYLQDYVRKVVKQCKR